MTSACSMSFMNPVNCDDDDCFITLFSAIAGERPPGPRSTRTRMAAIAVSGTREAKGRKNGRAGETRRQGGWEGLRSLDQLIANGS